MDIEIFNAAFENASKEYHFAENVIKRRTPRQMVEDFRSRAEEHRDMGHPSMAEDYENAADYISEQCDV